MHLRFLVLAVALSSLASVHAQEPTHTPPGEVAPPATSADAGTEASAPDEPPVAPRIISAPLWRPPENCDRIHFYPREAHRQDVEGVANLDCLVDGDGRLSCTIVDEEPAGFGFGEAALQISTCFRMQPRDRDGELTAGGYFRIRLPFRLADN